MQGRFDDIRRAYLADRRFAMTMMSAFGALAFVLTAVGLYGVIAYLVQLRTREIGIRMALGASASAVRWQILRTGLLLSLSGIAIGCLAASVGGGILRASIPGLAGVDPVEMAILAVGLVAVSVRATWLPAARATRVDPLITLRGE